MKCSLVALGAVAFTTIIALPTNPEGRVAPPATTFVTSIIKTHPPAAAPTEIVRREMDKGMLDKRENVRIATREMDKGMLDKREDEHIQLKKKIGGFLKSCHEKLGSAMKMNLPAFPHHETALEDATGRVATINPRGAADADAHLKEDEPLGMKVARKIPVFNAVMPHHDSKKEKAEPLAVKLARKIPVFNSVMHGHDSKKEKAEALDVKVAQKVPIFNTGTLRRDSKKEKAEPMGMKSARQFPVVNIIIPWRDSKKDKADPKSARRAPVFEGAALHQDSKEKVEPMGMKVARRLPVFVEATFHNHDSKEDKDN